MQTKKTKFKFGDKVMWRGHHSIFINYEDKEFAWVQTPIDSYIAPYAETVVTKELKRGWK